MSNARDDIEARFGYHRANADSAPKHNAVREEFQAMARRLEELLPTADQPREVALVMTKLQEAMHWANSAIAMQNDVDRETADQPNAPA